MGVKEIINFFSSNLTSRVGTDIFISNGMWETHCRILDYMSLGNNPEKFIRILLIAQIDMNDKRVYNIDQKYTLTMSEWTQIRKDNKVLPTPTIKWY